MFVTGALSKSNAYDFLQGNNAAAVNTPLEEAKAQVDDKRFANYSTGTLALAIPPEVVQACSTLKEIHVTSALSALASMCAAVQTTLRNGGRIYGLVNPSVIVNFMPMIESVNDLSDSMKDKATFPLEYMDTIATIDGLPAWDILPGERVDFHNVFKLYRDSRYFLLDTGEYSVCNRTIAGLAKQLGIAGSTLTYISKIYSWTDRCALYDMYMEAEMQKRKAQQETIIRNEHLKIAQQLTNKAWKQLNRNLDNLNPKELIQVLELGIKYSRISAGMLPDKPGELQAARQTNLSIYNNTTNNSADQMLNINAGTSTPKSGTSAVEQQLAEDMKDENNLLSILHVLQASGAMKTAIHADLVEHGEEGLDIDDSDEEEL